MAHYLWFVLLIFCLIGIGQKWPEVTVSLVTRGFSGLSTYIVYLYGRQFCYSHTFISRLHSGIIQCPQKEMNTLKSSKVYDH